MITKIAIENFKGIRDRVEFELKPLTLLFGANSAGKSTVLHALHYAREVFERHNLDADQTIAGGRYIDLGGYSNFAHHGLAADGLLAADRDYGGHGDGSGSGVGTAYGEAFSDGSGFGDGGPVRARDGSRSVCLGITVDLTQVPLPTLDIDFATASVLADSEFDSLIRHAATCAVEIAVNWSNLENCPYVASSKIFYDGTLYVELTADSNLGGAAITQLATDHSSLTRIGDLSTEDETQPRLFDETLLAQGLDRYSHFLSLGDEFGIELAGRGDALPDLDDDWKFVTEPPEIPSLPKGVSAEEVKKRSREVQEIERLKDGLELFSKAIIESVVAPIQLVRQLIQQFRYLGPLRETPPRNYEPPRFADPARWSSGLGAWDTLHTASDAFVDEVASWLGDEDRLDSGYRVERRHYQEFDLADPFLRKLMSGRAFDEADESEGVNLASSKSYSRLVIVPENSALELRPHDVGIGISQVVPVVVTALDCQRRLIAIEQPELHLHPRLAVALADLFISAACGPRRQQFILETHSGLIPLRVMRRVREAEQADDATHPLRTQDVVIYYVKQREGCTDAVRIDLDARGEFIQPWPDDFFEIDFHERFG